MLHILKLPNCVGLGGLPAHKILHPINAQLSVSCKRWERAFRECVISDQSQTRFPFFLETIMLGRPFHCMAHVPCSYQVVKGSLCRLLKLNRSQRCSRYVCDTLKSHSSALSFFRETVNCQTWGSETVRPKV